MRIDSFLILNMNGYIFYNEIIKKLKPWFFVNSIKHSTMLEINNAIRFFLFERTSNLDFHISKSSCSFFKCKFEPKSSNF